MALEPASLVPSAADPCATVSQRHGQWQDAVAAAQAAPPSSSPGGAPNVPQSPAQIQAYLDSHPHASARAFDIPKKPDMGTVTGEFFIAADQVPGGSPVSLRGNGRDFNPRFDVGNTKASLSLDFKSGKGIAIVNGTDVDVHYRGLDAPVGAASAQPIHINTPDASDHDTKIGIKTRANGDVEVKLHAAEGLDEHIPDIALPGGHRQGVAPEIDSTVVLSKSGGHIESGDLFPSVGLYRWKNGQVQTLQQRSEHHPWDLVDNIGNTGQG